MDQPSPPSVPPACGECLTVTKLANSTSLPQQTPTKLFRASDGKMRVDSGNYSVITDPVTQKTIVLDHLKKEANIFPKPPAPPGVTPPNMPGMPGLPGPVSSAPPLLSVKDLGKKMIDGHEADGKLYTLPEPADFKNVGQVPQMKAPQMGIPQMPQVPGIQGPKGPQIPQMPSPQLPVPQMSQNMPLQVPQLPQSKVATSEVWTSTKLNLPVLTKTTGSFGEQTCQCKYTETGEPHPSKFEVPPDYKTLHAPVS